MRAVRYSSFADEEERIEWIVADLLPNVGWTLFVGAKGSGKSTFCLQLCAALEKGADFLGKKTLKKKTLYIQADSPTVEWREMVRLIVPKEQGFTVVNVPSKCLNNESEVRRLDDLINDKVNPDFIVWDSLYNLTSSSINSESVLVPIQTMKMLSRDRSWLLIHHPPNEELRAAGHHSLGANCSRLWLLSKNRLKIDKGRLSNLKEIKMTRQEDEHGGLWSTEESHDSLTERLNRKYPSMSQREL